LHSVAAAKSSANTSTELDAIWASNPHASSAADDDTKRPPDTDRGLVRFDVWYLSGCLVLVAMERFWGGGHDWLLPTSRSHQPEKR
jgi:hypothetical protein